MLTPLEPALDTVMLTSLVTSILLNCADATGNQHDRTYIANSRAGAGVSHTLFSYLHDTGGGERKTVENCKSYTLPQWFSCLWGTPGVGKKPVENCRCLSRSDRPPVCKVLVWVRTWWGASGTNPGQSFFCHLTVGMSVVMNESVRAGRTSVVMNKSVGAGRMSVVMNKSVGAGRMSVMNKSVRAARMSVVMNKSVRAGRMSARIVMNKSVRAGKMSKFVMNKSVGAGKMSKFVMNKPVGTGKMSKFVMNKPVGPGTLSKCVMNKTSCSWKDVKVCREWNSWN